VKKYLGLISLAVIIAIAVYSYVNDESYDYYDRAKVLYEEGKYIEAYEQLEIGQSINQLNRKIISLKGKLYPIVEGAKNYKEANALYEEAINLALNGKTDAAKIAMSQAYDLAYKVSASSLVRDEAQELIRKIARDATLVLDSAPGIQYKNAIKHEAEGDLVRAYEALNNIDIKNEKIKRKQSEIAYRLGEQRYMKFAGQEVVSEHLVRDAIYWYSQVHAFDDNYMNANQRINELKLLKTK